MAVKRTPTVAVYLRTARRAVYKAELLARETGQDELAAELREVLVKLEAMRPKRRDSSAPLIGLVPHCAYL